jgi:hypothetical protein
MKIVRNFMAFISGLFVSDHFSELAVLDNYTADEALLLDACIHDGDYGMTTISHANESLMCPNSAHLPYVCHQDQNVSQRAAFPRFEIGEYIEFLTKHRIRLGFVGDSLTLQMWRTHLCLTEDYEARNGKLATVPFMTSFIANSLGALPRPFAFKGGADFQWVEHLFTHNITHVVINTGAWWGLYAVTRPSRPKSVSRQQYVLSAFHAHFAPKSPLSGILRKLKERGVVVIWRDNTQAGRCTDYNGYDYYALFPMYNAIARAAVLREGGLVIPDIWASSVSYWGDHRHEYNDTLHWCEGTINSLPVLWNQKLYALLQSTLTK